MSHPRLLKFPARPLTLLLLMCIPSSGHIHASPEILKVDPKAAGSIDLDPHGFRIGGKRIILLAGTVQYPRMDRDDWDRALSSFAASGFNTVDTLVPWNEHEPVEGKFDFQSGNLDLRRYLDLCRKHHLYVVIRPGPYICNEWDGGGLPAWLYTWHGLELRQNNRLYLDAARRYLREVDRIIRPMQITEGGPVILYQIENELDFDWACRDRTGVMTALRDAVREDGISIPITACIGSDGHVAEATGDVDGLFPTANLYVSVRVEHAVHVAAQAILTHVTPSGQSLSETPLYVSETDRNPLILRRLLAGGARGICPFNFAGGMNWNRSNGTTAWDGSTPVATAVDFGGMIGFDLQLRPRYAEAVRLARAVSILSEVDPEWESVESSRSTFSVSNPALGSEGRNKGAGGLYAIKGDGGQFLFLLNNTGVPEETHVTWGRMVFPEQSRLVIAPHSDPMLPVHVSLKHWGSAFNLDYATAELRQIEKTGKGIRVTFGAPSISGVEVGFSSPSAFPPAAVPAVKARGRRRRIAPALSPFVRSWAPGLDRAGTLRLDGGFEVDVRIENDDPLPSIATGPETALTAWQSQPLRLTSVGDVGRWSGGFRRLAPGPNSAPGSLELAGILRGSGWYHLHFDAPGASRYTALWLQGAAGLVTACLNGKNLGFRRGVGDRVELPLGESLFDTGNDLLVRVEIWGHSNFNNAAPPINQLGSLRGLLDPVVLSGSVGTLPLAGRWEIAVDPIDGLAFAADRGRLRGAVPIAASNSQPIAAGSEGGEFRLLSAGLPDGLRRSPGGLDLVLRGRNTLETVYVGGRLLGRCILGPDPPIHVVGGPANVLYIPPAWLRSSQRIEIVVEGTASPWMLESVGVIRLGSQG